MAKTKQQKQDLVKVYKEIISKSNAVLFAKPHALTVNEINDAKKKLGDQEGAAVVVKNTLFKRALKESNIEYPVIDDKGMNLIFFSFKDAAFVAKTMDELAKAERITIKESILNGQKITGSQVKVLASLPSLDVMRAKFVGTLNAPITGMVNVISGNIRGFMNVLTALQQTHQART